MIHIKKNLTQLETIHLTKIHQGLNNYIVIHVILYWVYIYNLILILRADYCNKGRSSSSSISSNSDDYYYRKIDNLPQSGSFQHGHYNHNGQNIRNIVPRYYSYSIVKLLHFKKYVYK